LHFDFFANSSLNSKGAETIILAGTDSIKKNIKGDNIFLGFSFLNDEGRVAREMDAKLFVLLL
jgi:hypothetical protein